MRLAVAQAGPPVQNPGMATPSCPMCRATLTPGASSCPGCGTLVEYCESCGAAQLPADRFCPSCGTGRIAEPQPAAPVVKAVTKPPVPAAPPVRRPKRPIALSAAAVVVLAGLAFVAFRGDRPAKKDRQLPVSTPDSAIALAEGGEDLAAAAGRVAAGGTIALGPGRFPLPGGLVLKQAIRIVGRGPDSTVIDLTGPRGIEVLEGTSGVELLGFQVSVAAGVPAAITTAGSRLDDLSVTGPGAPGEDCGTVGVGILVAGSGAPNIARVKAAGFCVGLRITDSAAPLIRGVTVTRNATAIQFMKQAGGSLLDSDVSGNRDGIIVVGGQPSIDNNTIQKNEGFGLKVFRKPAPTVGKRNRIRGNGIDVELP